MPININKKEETMIEKYLHLDYSSFDTDYSIKDQQLMTEESLNKSPRKLKKEQNDTYNLLQIMNGFLAIAWVDVEFYDQGEIVLLIIKIILP